MPIVRLLAGIAIVASCGGRQEPNCFECGLTDEWARAEREAQERSARERKERIEAIERAVAQGEPPQTDPHGPQTIISEAFEDNDEQIVQALVAALEKSCTQQASLSLAWTYAYFSKHAPDHSELSRLRRQAFEQIAASRGGASAQELAGCPSTPIAELCVSTTSTAEARKARCAASATDAGVR